MAKKNGMGEGPNSNSGGAVAPAGDVVIDLTALLEEIAALCDKLVGITNILTDADFPALCEKLLALAAEIQALSASNAEAFAALQTAIAALATANAAGFASVIAAIETLCDKWEAGNEEQCKKLEALLECLQSQKVDVSVCCTGGATDATAFCSSIPRSFFAGNDPRCTYSFANQDLPNPYTREDVLAILPAGSTISDDPENPDRYLVCVSGEVSLCYSSMCRNEGQIIGTLTRVCFTKLPNTVEEVCTKYKRVWDKYSEPTADILTTQLAVQELMLQKLCESAEAAELQNAKLCLIEEHLNPAGACPAEVIELNKELQTLAIEGDVTENYKAGQAINLQNANGEACGTATVAEGPLSAQYNEENGQTVIKIVECELDEGKTPLVITQATPIAPRIVKALGTVKALTAVRPVAKPVATPIKETPTRG